MSSAEETGSMTPQERQLITGLFDRLSTLEAAPRDAAAERAIADEMARAPNAVYPLVQTVLVQDEALKRANTRIQELEAASATGSAPAEGGFLDSMRGALFGREAGVRGSVPSVRAGANTNDANNANNGNANYGNANYPSGPYDSAPPAMGGSFLGNAAATAAGVIGGSLLLDGIRSMFGHGHTFAGAYEPVPRSPWGGGGADSDLARQAGLNDIGAHRDGGDGGHAAGLFDTADNRDDADDADVDDDFDDGDFDGGDVA
jgi:uncharacterized protein